VPGSAPGTTCSPTHRIHLHPVEKRGGGLLSKKSGFLK
jgi:hypothetical protein